MTPAQRQKAYRDSKRWVRPLEYARRRCSDINHRAYRHYGGRGLKCTLSFEEAMEIYYRDNGDSLDKPSLDRIDPDKGYYFENCRFIELEENIRRSRPPGSVKHNEEWEE